ncbi:MAG TPA: hypothetical protein VD833_00595 [Vicinamibacterales bacterium]|nr:hypothetical protein [Vicinamibacterales bacterium]
MQRSWYIGVIFALCPATASFAQQRPLVTEDPETVGPGVILLEGGFDYQRDVFYPLSGLRGNLIRFPTLGVSFGLSSIAELQVDGGFYNRLDVKSRVPAPRSNQVELDGEHTTDVEDLVIATKLRLVTEAPGRAGFALRLATRLPNASHESGLGLDTTDFFASGLIGKTVQSVRIVGNFGIAILTKPTREDGQDDVITYGLSMARAVHEGVEVVGELNGYWNPIEAAAVGTESRSNLRFGGRVTYQTVRVDGGLIIGLTSRDPSFGVTTGVTWVFRGFRVP